MSAACDFLLRERDSRGWWRDFDVAGPSDAWVTGYVGTAMTRAPHAGARAAARGAWGLLRRQGWWRAGWGYNARVPADANSTAWVLHLAHRVQAPDGLRQRRAYRFLAASVRPWGGMATYAHVAAIARYTGAAGRFEGWASDHACVTAVAAALPGLAGRARLLGYLRDRQRADGSWAGYWWPGREYPSALAVLALRCAGDPADGERLKSAARWAALRPGPRGEVTTELEPRGSPFAAACVLQALAGSTAPAARQARERVVGWLLRAQRADGSWVGSARMRIPPPDLADPSLYAAPWGLDGRRENSVGTIVRDRGIYTTATVLSALGEIVPARSETACA